MIQEVFFRLHLATTFANKCVRVIDQVKVIKQSFYWISCGFCTFYIQHIYDHHAEKSLHLFLVNNPGMAMPFAMLLWSPDFRDRTALCNDFSQLFNIFFSSIFVEIVKLDRSLKSYLKASPQIGPFEILFIAQHVDMSHWLELQVSFDFFFSIDFAYEAWSGAIKTLFYCDVSSEPQDRLLTN